MKKGYFMVINGRDCFFETDSKNRTDKLALDFLNKIQNATNQYFNIDDSLIYYVKCRLMPAFCEVKILSNGRKYYDIFGDNFGGCGSLVDDGFTIIVK